MVPTLYLLELRGQAVVPNVAFLQTLELGPYRSALPRPPAQIVPQLHSTPLPFTVFDGLFFRRRKVRFAPSNQRMGLLRSLGLKVVIYHRLPLSMCELRSLKDSCRPPRIISRHVLLPDKLAMATQLLLERLLQGSQLIMAVSRVQLSCLVFLLLPLFVPVIDGLCVER